MAHEEKCNYIPITTFGRKNWQIPREDFVQNLKMDEHYIHWEFGG
jgi:hypothetical protein